MGKLKSAICLTLITLVVAVLCVLCFVPFPVGYTDADGSKTAYEFFNPIINWTEKSTDLGGYQYGHDDFEHYLGGGFETILYPEGVISRKEYFANRPAEDAEEYESGYVAYAGGALYLDKESVCKNGTEPTQAFQDAFAHHVEVLTARFESLHKENVKVEVSDGYTVRVSAPALDIMPAAFQYFCYMGNITVKFGSSLTDAETVFPEEGKNKSIKDYISGIGTRTAVGGTSYVSVRFTKAGNDLLAEATADAASSSGTLFFLVGEEQAAGISLSEQFTAGELTFAPDTTNSDSASIIATVLSTALEYDSAHVLKMNVGELYRMPATFGNSALTLAYAVFGICFAAMLVYFFIRYRRLAFAHLYTYLIFLVAMVLCVWSIGSLTWSVGTIVAFALSSILLCVSDALSYEYVRKEYATGKTIVSSVKSGYKKCFWHLFDLHIAGALLAAFLYFIAITELQAFALTLTLGILFSGVGTLVLNRFMWYITMPFAKNAGAFCHFKREEVEDDE